jgi:hypothetical protein
LASQERAACNGRVPAIVRGVKGKAGAVKLTAESRGERSAVLNLRTAGEPARWNPGSRQRWPWIAALQTTVS